MERTVTRPDKRQPRIRWSESEGFELRCERCGEWWPLDNDDVRTYWRPENGLRRCLACIREVEAISKRRARLDPERVARERAADRRRRRVPRPWRREQMRASAARYYEAHAEEIKARRRAAYWSDPEANREKSREAWRRRYGKSNHYGPEIVCRAAPEAA